MMKTANKKTTREIRAMLNEAKTTGRNLYASCDTNPSISGRVIDVKSGAIRFMSGWVIYFAPFTFDIR